MTSKMRAEALQAPAAIARLPAADHGAVQALARSLCDTPPQALLTVARGSSDHVAAYMAYLVMARLGRLVTSLPMSLVTLYPARLRCEGLVALAFSQSGRRPDLVASTRYFRAGGRRAAVRHQPRHGPGRGPGSGAEVQGNLRHPGRGFQRRRVAPRPDGAGGPATRCSSWPHAAPRKPACWPWPPNCASAAPASCWPPLPARPAPNCPWPPPATKSWTRLPWCKVFIRWSKPCRARAGWTRMRRRTWPR